MSTYNNFKDAFAAMGYKVKEPEHKLATAKCRICGGVMTQMEGTNVFVCHGNVDEEGRKIECHNTIFMG